MNKAEDLEKTIDKDGLSDIDESEELSVSVELDKGDYTDWLWLKGELGAIDDKELLEEIVYRVKKDQKEVEGGRRKVSKRRKDMSEEIEEIDKEIEDIERMSFLKRLVHRSKKKKLLRRKSELKDRLEEQMKIYRMVRNID